MDQVRAIVMALEGVRLAIIASDPTRTKSEYANSIVQSDRAMRLAHEIVQQLATAEGEPEDTPEPQPGPQQKGPSGSRRVK